ncbi:hypothetical protein GJ654_06730 [Rhodoblastus acidophilus]|uniref:Uncharacterized protein n=1 Tax=Rhodoblastus acidophilus TaxID=1074 RepID=A0A6N8DK36_RHOAC|nr:hypothetical protein [Rhodoblastus acidophilus]MCW2274117.1 hypothetical protein [Rhodoblastus acidophilus]MTV30688.1 hypothetical protein [Rhodoblastus acidophilus]
MSTLPGIRRAGPVRVTTAKDAVREFRREAGWREEEGDVPLSFPVVWMKHPAIAEPIRIAAEEVGLPVHESQEFRYAQPLQVDVEYNLMLELKYEADPARLVATAQIVAPSGVIIGTVVSKLRLIAMQPDLPS